MNVIEAFNQSAIVAKLSLLVGFGPLALGIVYVVRPAERTLAIMRPASLAAIFAAISGVGAGLIAILMGVAATLPQALHMPRVYMGLSEALVPLLVNFGLLAAAWLLVAVGMMPRPALGWLLRRTSRAADTQRKAE